MLTEENLKHLDDLYKLVCPSRDAENQGTEPFSQHLDAAAEHIYNLLEAKPKEVHVIPEFIWCQIKLSC